jgi:putative iron-regulated protein
MMRNLTQTKFETTTKSWRCTLYTIANYSHLRYIESCGIPRRLTGNTALNIKFWTIAALGGSAMTSLAAAEWRGAQLSNIYLSAETGEGGEAGPQPSSYQLLLDDSVMPKIDAKYAKLEYIESAFAMYSAAEADAKKLQQAIHALIKKPNEASLQKAKTAWLAARASYLPTEVFRYYDGPIDGPASSKRTAGPESRINAWPLNEAVIDALPNNASAAIIYDASIPMTLESIKKRDQAADEADVTTGFHAIEFVLWGPDLSASGPGARPATDFKTSKVLASVRRQEYLKLVSQLLVDDIASVRQQWDLNNPVSFAVEFEALNDYEAIGRMLRGIAMLSVEELASERLSVPLDSGMQEDETSCFSDNTHAEFRYGLQGIARVWRGPNNKTGVAAVLAKADPSLVKTINMKLDAALASSVKLSRPFDQMLLSDTDSAARRSGEQLVSDLNAFGQSLREAGRKLGVLVSIPGA